MKRWSLNPRNLKIIGLFIFICGPIIFLSYNYLFNCSFGYMYSSQFINWLDYAYKIISSFAIFLTPIGFVIILASIIWGSQNKFFGGAKAILVAVIFIFVEGVILASFNTSRTKPPSTSVKINLQKIQSQAETYFNEYKNYGAITNSCNTTNSLFSNPNIEQFIANAEKTYGYNAECISGGDSYAISVPIKTSDKPDNGLFCKKATADKLERWCIDSLGHAQFIKSAISDTHCPL
jgi:hypothetical protein